MTTTKKIEHEQDSGAFGGTPEPFGAQDLFGGRAGETVRTLAYHQALMNQRLEAARAHRRELERREFWKSIVQKACADAAAMGRVPGDEVKQAADLALRIFDETWGRNFTPTKEPGAP